MKIFRNSLIMGLLTASMFLLLAISYSFLLPRLSLNAIVLSALLVFLIFELGILAGIIIVKISSFGKAETGEISLSRKG